MFGTITLLPLLFLLLLRHPSPVSSQSTSSQTPLLAIDFPDPAILLDSSGTYYAFATSSGVINIQAASAPSPSGPWTYLSQTDLLPDGPGPWTAGPGSQTWAPSVVELAPQKYVLYYSGQLSGNNSAFHCVGAATASSVLGPYTPLAEPFACPLDEGGAIDPSGFLDPVSGKRYVVYKIDGNSLGNGGSCNNDVSPIVPTPILLQEVDVDDGITLVGKPVKILDRDEQDGPLVEAPDLWWDGEGGQYVLFYSNHCWSEPGYSVNYATSPKIGGVYEKAGEPLVATGDGANVTAPGGASSLPGGEIVFHGFCGDGRCLFGLGIAGGGEDGVVRVEGVYS
ncbi:family 43 putative glycoside hydrolase [Podospora australis]|uniref:Family 43 putative glycoside hydrolase n=1 Tax=Podospora australis TaxID=1536484 RepID=A0AAN6X3C5_9PEZI|nr:family 43 putative glycoside hydrolase [Podospora australis]